MDKTLAKGLNLLEIMATTVEPMRLSDIARAAELTNSNAYRLLQTLKTLGYVRQVPDGTLYEVTMKLFEVSTQIGRHQTLVTVARKPIEILSESVGENVLLSVRDGLSAVVVDRVQAPKMLRSFTRIGARAPLHAVSAGKVLLAHAPPQVAEEMAGRLEPLTPMTIADPDRLRAELAQVRAQGFALADGESSPLVRGVAIAIRNRHGDTAAALGISGPIERFDAGVIDGFLAALRQTRSEIEASWIEGYRPPRGTPRTDAPRDQLA